MALRCSMIRSVVQNVGILKYVILLFLLSHTLFIESLLTSNLASGRLSTTTPGSFYEVNSFLTRKRPIAVIDSIGQNLARSRDSSRLYGLDLFGLGAPEIVICALAVAVLYGPDRIKGQLKDNGVKGQIVADGWREEHNERIADVKKYAVMSRKKRAWKKINVLIENEDPVILAKLAELDAKSPDAVKALSISMEDEDSDIDYDDDDDDDDDEVVV